MASNGQEFSHYPGCRNRDPDNCGGCALTHGGAEGPNYAAWPLSYMETNRTIPAKWKGAFVLELASGNRAYADNVRATATRLGARFSDGTAFSGCRCVSGGMCDVNHDPATCICARCRK